MKQKGKHGGTLTSLTVWRYTQVPSQRTRAHGEIYSNLNSQKIKNPSTKAVGKIGWATMVSTTRPLRWITQAKGLRDRSQKVLGVGESLLVSHTHKRVQCQWANTNKSIQKHSFQPSFCSERTESHWDYDSWWQPHAPSVQRPSYPEKTAKWEGFTTDILVQMAT